MVIRVKDELFEASGTYGMVPVMGQTLEKVAKYLKDNDREYYIGMKVPCVIVAHKPKTIAIHVDDYYNVKYNSLDEVIDYETEIASKNSYGFDIESYDGGYDPIYYWDNAT